MTEAPVRLCCGDARDGAEEGSEEEDWGKRLKWEVGGECRRSGKSAALAREVWGEGEWMEGDDLRTWGEMFDEERGKNGDDGSFSVSPADLDFDREFVAGYKPSIEGVPFVAWSADWVYFPVKYDGAEWVGSVPRNPCSSDVWSPIHHGGG